MSVLARTLQVCMLLTVAYVLKGLFFGPLLMAEDVAVAAPAVQKNQYFSLLFPREFIELKGTTKELLVMLKHRERPYPTFNVIMQPAAIEITEGNLKRLTDDAASSYRKVGLTDTEVKSAEIRLFGDRPAFTAELTYSSRGVSMRSAATIITDVDRHYILTYLDPAADFEADRPLLNQLLAGLKFNEPMIKNPSISETGMKGARGWASVLLYSVMTLPFLIIVFIGLHFAKRRR